MKTVLHLIETAGPGGAETVFANVIRTLDSRFWRSVAVIPRRDWLYDRLQRVGVTPFVIEERRRIDPKFFLRIAKLIREFDVDIIHSHLFGSAVRAGLISRFCGIPAVATIHGVADVSAKERLQSLKFGIVNRGVCRVVFVSEPLRQSFLSAFPLQPARTAVIPNGIELDKFSSFPTATGLREELRIGPAEFVIGAVGNPGAAKGYDVLLGALKILKDRGCSCRCVIVGDLSKGRGVELEELRRSLGLTKDVLLAGFRDDLTRVFATFDIYVLASRSEGFSLSVLEAMAAGLPIVATRCGGPEHILQTGVTGLLVENGSAEAVAEGIERLKNDAELRSRLGRAARRTVQEKFRWEDTVRAYENLYRECLEPQNKVATPARSVQTRSRILVTDGEQRAALAAVRALGLNGFEVHVCSARPRSIAGESNYCQKNYQVADSLREPDQFLQDLLRLVSEAKPDVLLPITEASLLSVLAHRSQFKCTIPFAELREFERVCDKRAVLEAAKLHGIATPAQTELDHPDDVGRLNGKLEYPAVLKPFRSVAGRPESRVRASVAYAMNSAEAKRALHDIPPAAYPVLFQQRIDGPGTAISVLMWDGELLAAFAHRRIREKPPSGGVSVLRESIPLDSELLARSVALLHDLNWKGVAMVEYKVDRRTGIPYLMEINGRFWGSLQLAVDAGVNFPTLLVQAALGMKPKPVTDYEVGIRSRWEWGDVDNLLANLFHSSRRLSLAPSGSPRRRFAAVIHFLRAFGPRNRPEIFRHTDPRPFFQESKDWIRGK